MLDRFTQKAQIALDYAKKAALQMGTHAVGTEHILLGLLMQENGLAAEVLRQNDVTEKEVRSLIQKYLITSASVMELDAFGFTPMAQNVLESSHEKAALYKSQLTGTEHILLAILSYAECSGCRLLSALNVSLEHIYLDILSCIKQDGVDYEDDAMAYRVQGESDGETPVLDQYSRDLTAMAKDGLLDPVIGREAEISRVIQILSRRTKNNPCLIGEPGVGKTSIAEGLALRIVAGAVPDTIKNKRVVSLDLSGMVAGSKYRGEFEERIKNVINEVRANKNVMLFIDEIHTLIGAGGAEGALDAANIIKPSLARGEIQLIGATTISEYRKHIEKDAALERRFQPVMVEEPSEEESIAILAGLRKAYEDHHQVIINDAALDSAVKLSQRYITDRFLPDKAIDLIDEAASKVRLNTYVTPKDIQKSEEELSLLRQQKEEAVLNQEFERAGELKKKQDKLTQKVAKQKEKWEQEQKNHRPVVGPEEIADIVSHWTKIPVQSIQEEENKRLKNMEKTLHRRVVGQEEAVSAVSRAIRRGRVGLKDPKRPIGSFLFLGPTGVGKTELCKALSEAMFGTEQSIIRVDMSEYMEKHSVSKLIGSPPGYVGFEEGGQLSEKVRRNPYSVILFDEIEKAHPDVFNILLQVLDDGQITDSQGRKINFKNTIIIMTSNCGAENIITPKKLGFGSSENATKDYDFMKNRVMEVVRKTFKPEFLNRIDEIIVFHPLNRENMKEIVSIMLKNIINRAKNQMDITLRISSSAKELLIEKGYDEKYGARPLRRTIQNLLEDSLAEQILDGKIKEKSVVSVGREKEQLKFSIKNEE